MNILDELKRRRVFRALTIYAVVAWALIQVADVVAPHIGMPGWTVTLVIYLAAIGFPLVLVLSWIYDFTSTGLHRSQTRRGSNTRLMLAGMVVLIVAVGLAVLLTRHYAGTRPHPREETVASIAVLPFVNISADPEQEYFSDGLTEELLNALAQIPALHVAARTSSFSFKGRNVPVAEIGHALNVQTVLAGSVRKAGDRLRINAQLINAKDGFELWSQQYDRELTDIFAIQEEIGRAIVNALRAQLGPNAGQAIAVEAHNLEAYNHYLQGRFFWNRRNAPSLTRAQALLERAIELDPGFARAHAALADVYILVDQYSAAARPTLVAKARGSALRAVQLDSTLAEPHATLAQIHQRDYQWDRAEAEFTRALSKNPNYATAHQWRAWLLSYRGRPAAALHAIDAALRLDPLALIINENKAEHLLRVQRYDDAIAQLRHTLELDSTFAPAIGSLAAAYSLNGDHAHALLAAERATQLETQTRYDRGLSAYAFARAGQADRARAILTQMQEDKMWAFMAPGLLALGEPERALDVLGKAHQEGDSSLPEVVTGPYITPLQTHARFKALRRKLKLD